MLNKFSEAHKKRILDCRPELGDTLERTYKLQFNITPERFTAIFQVCEAYEAERTFDDLYNWSGMPEYLDCLDWLVYNMNSTGVFASSVPSQSNKSVKRYIRQRKHLNDFIEFARKHLKKSYSETLDFFYISAMEAV